MSDDMGLVPDRKKHVCDNNSGFVYSINQSVYYAQGSTTKYRTNNKLVSIIYNFPAVFYYFTFE